MLIGQPLLRACCFKCSKLPKTTSRLDRLSSILGYTRRHESRQIARCFVGTTVRGGGLWSQRTTGLVRRCSPSIEPGPKEVAVEGPTQSAEEKLDEGTLLRTSRKLIDDSIAHSPPDTVETPPEYFEKQYSKQRTRRYKPSPRSWSREDEAMYLERDRRHRNKAHDRHRGVKMSGPPVDLLEDTSRSLLKDLMIHDLKSKSRRGKGRSYKKGGAAVESEAEIDLLTRAIDTSITKIQINPQPGYHSLPFYSHKKSTALDASLINLLQRREPELINKVCYNLLISDAAPSLATFNILLRRFTKLRMTGLAHVIMIKLFAINFEPNAYTYTAILQYLTVTHNYDAFGKAVAIMRESFLDYRNPMLASAELNGWSKFGDFTSMRRRLRLLQEEGLRNDLFILTIELRYYAKRHMWEGGLPALGALMKTLPDDIDHRALFWAWKLCINCHQPDYADLLKKIVQEKRWPEAMLWTKPQKTKGLEYGFTESIVHPPDASRREKFVQERAQHVPNWGVGGEEDDDDEDEQEIRMHISARVEIPEKWEEYSAAFIEQLDGAEIVERSVILDNEAAKARSTEGETQEPAGSQTETEPLEQPSEKELPSSNIHRRKKPAFTIESKSSLWNTLLEKRKQQLLGKPPGK